MRTHPSKTLSVACPQWTVRLAALHPDDLTPDERASLWNHMSSCSDCAAVYAAYQAVDARILSLPVVQPSVQQAFQLEALIKDRVADDFTHKPATSVRETRPFPSHSQTRRSMVGSRLSALAAVLVVALLAGSAFALFSSHHTSTSTGSGKSGILYAVSTTGTAYAVDAGSGKTIWSTPLHIKPDEQFLVSNGTIFFASIDTRFLYALRISDGHVLWQRSYKNLTTVGGQTVSPTRYLASDGKLLYIGSVTGIYAWRVSDGQPIWHHAPSAACVANPDTCLIDMETVSNGLVYVYFDGLYALNTLDGSTRWSNSKVVNLDIASNPLVVVQNHVYVPNYDGKLIMRVLQADTGTLINTPGLPGIHPDTTLTDGQMVYFESVTASGQADIYAARASDDTVTWHNHYSAAVTLFDVLDGNLYYTNMTASTSGSNRKFTQVTPGAATKLHTNLAALNFCALSAANGSALMCQQVPGKFAPAVVSQGTLYAVGNGEVEAIRLSDNKVLWTAAPAHRLPHLPKTAALLVY